MTKSRILVVDDELDNRVMMRYFLESWGYEVELAADGQEALSRVAANPPHLVLLDLEMPVLNGFETCDRLKSNPATEQIPVIMFTGLEQTADKVRGIRKGADDYVVKTVDPEELQARIEMILRRTKRHEAAESPLTGVGQGVPNHAVSGSLAELDFPETMQLILAYGKTGVLLLQDGPREGRIHLKQGRVVHAEIEDREGEEAFYELALWKAGRFAFRLDDGPPRETINKSGPNLLIEAARRLDEWNLISSKIPSFDVAPVRTPLTGANSIRLTRKDWAILLATDGSRSIRRMAEELGMDLYETGRMIFNLMTVGVICLQDPAGQIAASDDRIAILATDLPAEGPFQLTALQWKVIAFVDGRRTVSAVAGVAGLLEKDVAKTLDELVQRGLVRYVQERPRSTVRGASSAGKEKVGVGENVASFRPRIRAVSLDG